MQGIKQEATKKFVSTEEYAAAHGIKPQTVRARVCRFGHYFGDRPEKCPNGRLRWPDEGAA